jgi:hypothetical protein
VATQDQRQAFTSFLNMSHFSMLMMISGLLMLTVLGAYVLLRH